jgi:hypothetical protein
LKSLAFFSPEFNRHLPDFPVFLTSFAAALWDETGEEPECSVPIWAGALGEAKLGEASVNINASYIL